MPCDPNDNSLNPVSLGPPPAEPGFGLPFSVPGIPFQDDFLPEGIPEDIINLVNSLLAALPGGILKPNPDNFMKDILDAVAGLMNAIGPYLALYNFFLALLNMVLCIIDVFCALLSPRKMSRAIKRLFKRCLPQFINLFPWIALLAMILALLLLLLALIEYIINIILQYIRDIIANLTLLSEAVQTAGSDPESTLPIVNKIAYLLCLIEQLFAILIAFQAIFAIIESLLDVAGRSVCASGGNRKGDDNDCCTDEVCPPFIRNQPDGFEDGSGELIYIKPRTDNVNGSPVRIESWQFRERDTTNVYKFIDIITPIDGFIFWPESSLFNGNSSQRVVPYILDFTISLNPADFGFSNPSGDKQIFQIKDVVVAEKPSASYLQYNDIISLGALTKPTGVDGTGVLRLLGGLVYKEDGVTPYSPNGTQLTLQTFIDLPSAPDPIISDDTVIFNLLSYNLRINHEALFGYGLITAMCIPDLEIEATVFANTIQIDSVATQIGNLPSPGNTAVCLQVALANFRKDVSVDNAAVFQADVEACLNSLQADTEESYVNTLVAGTSQFETTTALDPSLQFTGSPIAINVQLLDSNKVLLSTNIPASLASQVAARLEANVSLGDVSEFEYDGYNTFVANINSDVAGTGDATITFDNALISDILNRDNEDVSTSIQTRVLDYEFVGIPKTAAGVDADRQRRDETDIAGS